MGVYFHKEEDIVLDLLLKNPTEHVCDFYPTPLYLVISQTWSQLLSGKNKQVQIDLSTSADENCPLISVSRINFSTDPFSAVKKWWALREGELLPPKLQATEEE